jgi:hypothetical protein
MNSNDDGNGSVGESADALEKPQAGSKKKAKE